MNPLHTYRLRGVVTLPSIAVAAVHVGLCRRLRTEDNGLGLGGMGEGVETG
jgi:hypothetical protein